MLAKVEDYIIQYIKGNRNVIEVGKLTTVGFLAFLSLCVSIYFIYFSPYSGFRFVYVFIPHLYLIPIILLALWYPKTGMKLVILIFASLFLFWIIINVLGYTFPPLFVILYTGLDLAIFVVFLLYVKDRRLVEAIIIDVLERGADTNNISTLINTNFSGDFDAIIIALNSRDDKIREEAISALSELNDPRVIFPLINALHDENPYIRREAIEALEQTNSTKVIKPLIGALNDEDRYVREAAAEVLGHLGSIAIPELIKHLSDPNWRVRAGIMIALRISSIFKDTDQIIRMLYDESIYVRREAVKTLGRIGDKRVIPYLIQATNDTDSGVRIRAIRGLKKNGDPEEINPVLINCLNDPDGAVRLLVYESLHEKK